MLVQTTTTGSLLETADWILVATHFLVPPVGIICEGFFLHQLGAVSGSSSTAANESVLVMTGGSRQVTRKRWVVIIGAVLLGSSGSLLIGYVILELLGFLGHVPWKPVHIVLVTGLSSFAVYRVYTSVALSIWLFRAVKMKKTSTSALVQAFVTFALQTSLCALPGLDR